MSTPVPSPGWVEEEPRVRIGGATDAAGGVPTMTLEVAAPSSPPKPSRAASSLDSELGEDDEGNDRVADHFGCRNAFGAPCDDSMPSSAATARANRP